MRVVIIRHAEVDFCWSRKAKKGIKAITSSVKGLGDFPDKGISVLSIIAVLFPFKIE